MHCRHATKVTNVLFREPISRTRTYTYTLSCFPSMSVSDTSLHTSIITRLPSRPYCTTQPRPAVMDAVDGTTHHFFENHHLLLVPQAKPNAPPMSNSIGLGFPRVIWEVRNVNCVADAFSKVMMPMGIAVNDSSQSTNNPSRPP
jgi:hypothetical protein